jgi:hypothetical protein
MRRSRTKLGIPTLMTLVVGLLFTSSGVAAAQPATPPDGKLVLEWGTNESGDPTLRWGVSGSCYGNFLDPQQVNGIMEWGAESHCQGTGWTPHHLELVLQQKEVIDWGFDQFHPVGWAESGAYQFGDPNIGLYEHWRLCDGFEDTDYRIAGTLTAGPHEDFALSDEFTVNCLYDDDL